MISSCCEGPKMNHILDFLPYLTALTAGMTLGSFQLESFILIVQFKRRKVRTKLFHFKE